MLTNDHINFWFHGFPSGMLRMTKFFPTALANYSIQHADQLSIHFANPGTNADKLLRIAASGNSEFLIKLNFIKILWKKKL